MTMLCGSTTHVTIFGTAGAADEKVPVQCVLDDAHTRDHRGYFGAMPLTWPRDPSITVYRLDSGAELIPSAPNAACVIKVNNPDPDACATSPSNPIDDIRAAAEQMRRTHLAGPRPMSPWERAQRIHLEAMLSAAAKRLPPMEPEE